MKRELKILSTDIFFDDSPNAGEKNCICSRCKNKIKENEIPFRVFPNGEDFFTKHKETGQTKNVNIEPANGLEFRLCENCQQKYL